MPTDIANLLRRRIAVYHDILRILQKYYKEMREPIVKYNVEDGEYLDAMNDFESELAELEKYTLDLSEDLEKYYAQMDFLFNRFEEVSTWLYGRWHRLTQLVYNEYTIYQLSHSKSDYLKLTRATMEELFDKYQRILVDIENKIIAEAVLDKYGENEFKTYVLQYVLKVTKTNDLISNTCKKLIDLGLPIKKKIEELKDISLEVKPFEVLPNDILKK